MSGLGLPDTEVALARAAIDPSAAINAARVARAPGPKLEVVAGVPAPQRLRALTLAVEVDPPPEHSRWRFFVFWLLVRLAARVYPFHFEIYRTREPF